MKMLLFHRNLTHLIALTNNVYARSKIINGRTYVDSGKVINADGLIFVKIFYQLLNAGLRCNFKIFIKNISRISLTPDTPPDTLMKNGALTL